MRANTMAAVITSVPSETKDAYGNVVYSPGELVQFVPGIWWPAGSSESRRGGDQVTWRNTLLVGAEVDITAIDRVIPQAVLVGGDGRPITDVGTYAGGTVSIVGDVFNVDGGPTVWPETPSGWRPDFPVELALRRVSG